MGGAKSGTINPRGLCHFGLKKWSNIPSTEKNLFYVFKHNYSPTNQNTYQSWRGTLKRDF